MNLINKNKYLVTAIIVFLLISISFSNTVAQTTVNCDSSRIKIQEFAKRHASSKENMKTETILRLFANDSCYSSVQIAEIYENEYTANLEKPNIWESFIPKKNWIVGIILVVLGVFLTAIKKWIGQLFTNIGEWFYNKFSGSKLLRKKAITKYKQALNAKYKEVKIVFRPNRPLEMSEVFVPLKAVDASDKTQIEVLEAISQYDKVVVLGDPGSGKSMFCKNVLYKHLSKIICIFTF